MVSEYLCRTHHWPRQFDPTQLTNDLTRPQEPTEDDPLYTDINNAQTANNATANNQAEDNEEATDENNPGPSGLQSGGGVARKRQKRDQSPQPGPSTLQSDVDSPRRRFRTALNTFEVVKIFLTAAVFKDLLLFLNSSEKEVNEILEKKAQEKRGIKFYLNVKIRFVRYITETEKGILSFLFPHQMSNVSFGRITEGERENGFRGNRNIMRRIRD
ncbi:hypothetical protein AVEN_143157-1 [Araneus ventricosus]|uniref:Uncharacterized protein n=1 Tax=Araneus ventricosus TaxID=182803 RepID=A0A4Y2JTD3_ARAVE|nr:hypothetical protein AVEN_143157-1 [Araneus ventricosus]